MYSVVSIRYTINKHWLNEYNEIMLSPPFPPPKKKSYVQIGIFAYSFKHVKLVGMRRTVLKKVLNACRLSAVSCHDTSHSQLCHIFCNKFCYVLSRRPRENQRRK